MLYVTLFNARPGTAMESTRRRLDWENAPDVKIIGEYWLPSNSPRVVLISEAESMDRVMDTHLAWDAFFEMQTFPAITADEGLRHARERMAQMGTMPTAAPAGATVHA